MTTTYLMCCTSTGGRKEYLESVSSDATTWTTDPNRAIHFLSEQLVPITTVILRYPFLNQLKDTATESEKNQRKRIVDWFKENAHLLPAENFDAYLKDR